MSESSDPTPDDAGLDSAADLRILTRILLFGLTGAVVVAAIAFLLTGDVALIGVLVGGYAVIAATQWYAASRRAAARRGDDRP